MILHGEFVRLRPIDVEDADITLAWRLSERAKLMQSGAKTLEEQKNWIIGTVNNPNEHTFIIEYKDKPVGMFAIYKINHSYRNCVIGRLLIGEQDYVGNAPVAFESELLLCDYIFSSLNMHKINGDILESNKNMIKFRRYLGYSFDGMLRDEYLINGVYHNIFLVSIFNKDYWEVCRPKLKRLITLSL